MEGMGILAPFRRKVGYPQLPHALSLPQVRMQNSSMGARVIKIAYREKELFSLGGSIGEKGMQDITRDEIAKLVAKYAGRSKKDCVQILDTYYIVVKEAILAGLTVTIPGVCSLSNTQAAAKDSREYYCSLSDSKVVTEAHEAYNKPHCKFKPSLKQEMREKTEGQVF